MKREWLIQKRKSKGLKQTELADKVGASNKTISRIELGQRNPSGKIAMKIAEVLEFNMERFYLEDEKSA